MHALQPMRCRVCGAMIAPNLPLAGRRATSWDTCAYRCGCGWAYSNAADPEARTQTAREPELNVPAEVAGGLAAALDGAFSELNRRNKRAKFCFETSEDAVTWTVCRYLAGAGLLRGLVGADGPAALAGGPAALLLWGAPVYGADTEGLAAALGEVCDSLGEPRDRRSEPDAIVAWPELIVQVEAKYRSRNDRRPGYAHFRRYLDRRDLYAAPEAVAEAGYYELARNWRIGVELAERTGRGALLLVNLGPTALGPEAQAFAAGLVQTDRRRFRHRRWVEVLEATERAAPLPQWMARYADSRGLRAL